MAVTGGIAALWIRDMPFSITGGGWIIAHAGVAVLNGLVLVTTFNQLRAGGEVVADGDDGWSTPETASGSNDRTSGEFREL